MSTPGQAPNGSTGQEPNQDAPNQGEQQNAQGQGQQAPGQEPTQPNQDPAGQQEEQGAPALTPEQTAELRREAAKYRTRAQAAEAEVQKFKQAQMTDQERRDAELKSAQESAQEATLRANRLEVAMSKGLAPDALEFLHGSTKEELEANADKLVAMLGSSQGSPGPGVPFDGGFRGGAGSGQPQDMSTLIRQAAGRQ